MEEFISYTLGIAANRDDALRPVYSRRAHRPDGRAHRASPHRLSTATGRCASATRPSNRSSTTPMAALSWPRMPMFFDLRLPKPADASLFHLLESLGAKAAKLALEPDAGIWEHRQRQHVHTHSAAMCWAGCQRLAAIASPSRAARSRHILERYRRSDPHESCSSGAWNPARGAFTAAFGSDDLDASVLLLPDLGVIDVNDDRFVATVAAIERELLREKHVMRYVSADDFGLPTTAFLTCRFWLIDAWWSLGRREEAHDLFIDVLKHRNRYGLLSEDIDPKHGSVVGQFSADLLDGRIDPDRNAAVAKLGGPILGRLIIVSNRVALPTREGGAQAGGSGGRDARCPAPPVRASGSDGAEASHRMRPAQRVRFITAALPTSSPISCRRITTNTTTASPTGCCGRSCTIGSTSPSFCAAISPATCGSTSISPVNCIRSSQPDDLIWVHDYHLMPLARMLRERGHRNRIGFFLHVPFPPPEIMTALPNHERLIPSLSYYDLAGFQTTNDAGNFARYLVRECRFTKIDPRHVSIRRTPRSHRKLPDQHRNRGVQPVGTPLRTLAVRQRRAREPVRPHHDDRRRSARLHQGTRAAHGCL